MANEIRTFGDPVLKSRATSIKEFDESLERLAADMFRIMRENEGVGLAANQIGRLKRIFVASFDDEDYAIVNPQIESSSEETSMDLEGCLSVPGIGVEVERAAAVTVTGRNPEGVPVRVDAEGRLARIFQHEIDHLDGVLFLDRTDRESRKRAMREWRERLLEENAPASA
ncbi:MAG: peptide deformylase [Rubrobacter sp.]